MLAHTYGDAGKRDYISRVCNSSVLGSVLAEYDVMIALLLFSDILPRRFI